MCKDLPLRGDVPDKLRKSLEIGQNNGPSRYLVLGFSMAQTKIMKDHAMLEKWAKSNGIYGVLPKTKDGKIDTDLSLKLTGILVSIWPELIE